MGEEKVAVHILMTTGTKARLLDVFGRDTRFFEKHSIDLRQRHAEFFLAVGEIFLREAFFYLFLRYPDAICRLHHLIVHYLVYLIATIKNTRTYRRDHIGIGVKRLHFFDGFAANIIASTPPTRMDGASRVVFCIVKQYGHAISRLDA